jgi:nitrous oxidase accessory protein NosD
MGEPEVESLFPLFSGENIRDVVFENLTLDGNKANNGNLDGNYAGCIWLQDCNRITMRKVASRNYNGDAISWQICHDVLVEDCQSHHHTGPGLHPGSGSKRSIMRRNRMSGNDQGLFFCWSVKWALAEKNYIENSRRYGISIGHHDTDNIVRDNDFRSSGQVGILFRKERAAAFQGHPNRIENNRIEGVMQDNGVGIDVPTIGVLASRASDFISSRPDARGASTRDIRAFYYRSYALHKGGLLLTLFAGGGSGRGCPACIESDSC